MHAVYLRLSLTTFIWALVFHAGAYAVEFMHPTAAAAWRFILAVALLLPLVSLREGWPLPLLRANAWALTGMALSGVFVFNVAMFYGLRRTSAVNAALIMALSPALTAVLNAGFTRRPIEPLQWLGLVLGIAGVACVVSGGSWTLLRHLQLSSGDALLLLACVSWSIYATIPRWVHGLSPLQMTGAGLVIGAVLLTGLAVATSHSLRIASPALAAVLLFIGIVGSALALVWWNDGVQRLGSARATLFMNLTPVFAVLIDVATGHTLTWAHVVGAVLVIGGVTCSVWGKAEEGV